MAAVDQFYEKLKAGERNLIDKMIEDVVEPGTHRDSPAVSAGFMSK